MDQLSRFVSQREANRVKKDIKNGTTDIVIGTHALLSETIDFSRLGLVIIDEEQHFGVVHKERLKKIKSDVHVLTLTHTQFMLSHLQSSLWNGASWTRRSVMPFTRHYSTTASHPWTTTASPPRYPRRRR